MAYISAEKLASLGFSDKISERRPCAVVSLAGLEGSGKTDFALKAPKPLFYQSTDFGDEGVIQKATGQIIRPTRGDYKLNIPPHLFDKPSVEKGTDRQARESELAKWVQQNFVVPFTEDYRAMLKAGVRSVVWDTALEVWEFIRLSVYGRAATNRSDLQAEANTKFKELVREASIAGANLIMIQHLKPAWESYSDENGNVKWRKTADFEVQGFEKAPFLVTANLWTKFTPPGDWQLTVKKCRDNPAVVGVTIPATSWAEVMSVLIPSVPAESWE
jgi:AAA domain-containing protein